MTAVSYSDHSGRTAATMPTMAYDHDLANRIRELVAAEQGIDEKRMFGGLAFLVNGNMSVSASSKGGLLVRVDPAEVPDLLGADVHVAIMGGRDMKGWLRVDAAVVDDDGTLKEWVDRSVAFARTLPAK
jgi:TfoX/Sxy family transcriptional regulator of competence genes